MPGDERVCPSCGAISLPGSREPVAETMLARLKAALGHRYRIEREIGQGGMAVVYLAHDLRHDRSVALKVLRPELSAYLGAERFLREIHIAAQLNHPHIIALHDSGEADGLLYFVMPYVEGQSLRQRLTREGPLPLEDAVTIAGEVADGLAYAHELNVVHRDIKPENILLSHGHAAIADFGIARALAGAGAGTTITTTGVSPGTPLYMSPEQAAGEHAVDQRSDIYSLGCVLFEMLSGSPPYSGVTPQALLVQHATEPVPSPRAARAEVSESLDAAVRRALAKSPGDRFQSAAAFRAALGGPPGSAAVPSPGPRASRWRRRSLLAAAGVVVVGAALVALLGRGPAPAPAPRTTLVVVVRPFEDRTGREREAARAITEALTERLEKVPALGVVPYSAVADLRDVSLDTLRARFNPDRIVTGYMAAAGDRLLVAAQIVNARTLTAPPADSSVVVPRGSTLVDAAAERLSAFVRHAFWSELEKEARRSRVGNAQTWRLVERARELRLEGSSAIEYQADGQGFRSLDLADSLLAAAGERDRSSDLIPADRARLANLRGFFLEAFGQLLRNRPANLGGPAAERRRAVALLDPLISAGHAQADAFELRGDAREGLYRELHDDTLLAGATADYLTATELDPHRAMAWQSLAGAYLASGAWTDALWATQHGLVEDAFALNGAPLLRDRFDAALRAGQFTLADSACAAGAAQWPTSSLFNDCRLQLWAHTRGDRRTAALARAMTDSLAPGEFNPLQRPLRELWVADILARAGMGDSADHVARRATAHAPPAWQPFLLDEEAYLRMLRNDPDSALALIAAVARLDPTTRSVIRAVPWFVPLHADPRFTSSVGLPSAH